jgi:nucleoside-diphosphate-sugar epimerase/uncharacterized membrane protein
MRVVVVGATGNAGTSLLEELAAEKAVDSVLGVARRLPALEAAKTEWARADITADDLVPLFRGADAVVHLAWAVQPSRNLAELERINVLGSERLFRAVAEADVPSLVYASSVGAYSPGPKDRFVDESWPVEGTPSSFYARHKAEVERRLDRFQQEHPDRRVVRFRPGLVFKREAATAIRRLFAGPFLPSPLVKPSRIPFVPGIPGLRLQAVHSRDVGRAYRLAVVGDMHGPFNIAAEPVLDPTTIAKALGAKVVPLSAHAARALASTTWHLRLQPTPPGWLDMGLSVPLMDVTRARTKLGWEPQLGADEALRELLEGMSEGIGAARPLCLRGEACERRLLTNHRTPVSVDAVACREQLGALDDVAEPLQRVVCALIPARSRAKDALSGTWLGHPLHPPLTDLVVGSWTSALLLDLVGGEGAEDAAARLVGVGVLAALPTSLSGLSDWADVRGGSQRVGTLHAIGNTTALTLQVLSLFARRGRHRPRALLLSGLGVTAANLSAWLGGHLSFSRGVGVNERPPSTALPHSDVRAHGGKIEIRAPAHDT